MEMRILIYLFFELLISRTYPELSSQMSHQFSNLQKFGQPQQNQIYEITDQDEAPLVPSTSNNHTQPLIASGTSGRHVDQQQSPCAYPTNQAGSATSEFASWRQSATVEDWKEYLYSPTARPTITVPSNYNSLRHRTQIALQHPQIMLRRQLLNRPMTPFMYNVDSALNNALTQERLQAHMNFHQTLQRGYKQVIEDASRNAALKAAIQSRRNFVGKLRANNAESINYYRGGCVEQKKIRKPNFYSPELIRYIDPTIFEREWRRAGLEYVESLLDNADEYGYVTIDTRAMKTLVTVIDKILPKNLDLNALKVYTL